MASATTGAGPVSPGFALFTTLEEHRIGFLLRLATELLHRGVERGGVVDWCCAFVFVTNALTTGIAEAAADEVERERDVVRRDREVLDRCRGLQHLHIRAHVGVRGTFHEGEQRGAETECSERSLAERASRRKRPRLVWKARTSSGSTPPPARCSRPSSVSSSRGSTVARMASRWRSSDCSMSAPRARSSRGMGKLLDTHSPVGGGAERGLRSSERVRCCRASGWRVSHRPSTFPA